MMLFSSRRWSEIKKSLGYGSMSDEDRVIADMLASKVIPEKDRRDHSFDTTMKAAVTGILLQIALPWYRACLEKYSEEEYHYRFAHGFDLIRDWHENHAARYRMFIASLRVMKHRVYFDENIIAEAVAELLRRKGWTVYPAELEALKQSLRQIKQEAGFYRT